MDRDRIYWLLVIRGPLTMGEIRQETNWTTHRLNKVLYDLKGLGCVALTERGQHQHAFGRCGKWAAVQDEANAHTHLMRYRRLA